MNGLRWTLSFVMLASLAAPKNAGAEIELQLRYQKETSTGSGRYHRLTRKESWKPEQTAVIVCDVWDMHHCLNAVRRAEEFAPRLNQVIAKLRQQGVTVIHAPSDCMNFYADHPARKRASETPKASPLPPDIQSWCSRIPSEEKGVYPIDQSDGGEDDDPQEHAEWAAKLQAMGRNPKAPWKKQSDLIDIDVDRDFISDKGDEVWSILQQRGIDNVILTGVHTNMCVLGRPFGLRQMARNGKNVVLMRDMTDTMYNPARWPYVSHFTGTDLIVSHIEKFVCPTVASDQVLGGKPFVFKNDRRPHLAIVMAELEYETDRTLPEFAAEHLGKQFRVSYVFADDKERNNIPGLEVLAEADLALISVRRRVLPLADLKFVRDFIAVGKPVVGIRTASHAFSLGNNKEVPKGLVDWPEFDAQVFGGNYHGHHPNNLPSTVSIAASDHPLVQGLPESFTQKGSLYMTSPLAAGTHTLLVGKAEGFDPEPVAWTFRRADGGLSFYSSLGHPEDFKNPAFVQLLANAIAWAAQLPTGGAEDAKTEPEELFVARPLTKPGEFTRGVEGPACDAAGRIYAVNFAKQGTIGRVSPSGQGEVFVELPEGSVGNGIRFDAEGLFYVADYTGHNVLRVDPATKKIEVFAHEASMSQPNDLAIAADGTLYASDPNWGEKTGQIWRIDRDGRVTRVAADLGTTNGVEVSPDGRTLYVNESIQRNIWAFPIAADGRLGTKRLLRKFDDHGFDGMRCDVDGNLYVTRHGKGTVVKLSPDGEILKEVDVLGKHPTNICFGGPDGRTAYVTEAEHSRLVEFRVDRPGLSWKRWQDAK